MNINAKIIYETIKGRPVKIAPYTPMVEDALGHYSAKTKEWIFNQEERGEVFVVADEPVEFFSGRWFAFVSDEIGDWLYLPLDCLIFCSADDFLDGALTNIMLARKDFLPP